jgi:ADP-ribose pyrophosphatase
MWQLPGGSMNKNEEIELAAKRELAEESGYSANKTEIIGYFYTQNRLSNQRQHVVLCTELYKHELPADEDEFIDTYWITKKKIELMISKGEINNINTLAALNIWFYNK